MEILLWYVQFIVAITVSLTKSSNYVYEIHINVIELSITNLMELLECFKYVLFPGTLIV